MLLTFCKTPVICSYFPVEFGKFSKLITGETSFEKLSGLGNFEYGEALFSIGVPKLLTFTTFLSSILSSNKFDSLLGCLVMFNSEEGGDCSSSFELVLTPNSASSFFCCDSKSHSEGESQCSAKASSLIKQFV